MGDKAEHIRVIALELAAHLPLDFVEATAVMDHLRLLVEWRRAGILPLPPRAKLTVVPFDNEDRYSTEVVLQGFNSQLVMLDRMQRGGAAAADSRAASHESWAAPAQSGPAAEFNDEIPF